VLGKIYSNGSIVSVDMDVVGVMVPYLHVVLVCTAQSTEELPDDGSLVIQNMLEQF